MCLELSFSLFHFTEQKHPANQPLESNNLILTVHLNRIICKESLFDFTIMGERRGPQVASPPSLGNSEIELTTSEIRNAGVYNRMSLLRWK